MIRDLPLWSWPGAWMLAAIAGLINVIGFLSFSQEAISHLTGTTSLLAIGLMQDNAALAANSLAITAAYLLGTFLSGVIILDQHLRLGRRYGAVLLLESLTLFAAALLLWQGQAAGLWLAAGACGLQNAMTTTWSGAIIRTTHITGMLTDLGIFMGQALRGLRSNNLRLLMSLNVISGFLLGGLGGVPLFAWLGYGALLVPAGLTGLTGLVLVVWLQRQRWAKR